MHRRPLHEPTTCTRRVGMLGSLGSLITTSFLAEALSRSIKKRLRESGLTELLLWSKMQVGVWESWDLVTRESERE